MSWNHCSDPAGGTMTRYCCASRSGCMLHSCSVLGAERMEESIIQTIPRKLRLYPHGGELELILF